MGRLDMINDVFVTKLGMTQAWTAKGRRLAITRCSSQGNMVLGVRETVVTDRQSQNRETKPATILEVGYGHKKLKNMTKPLRSKLEKSGFSIGAANITGVRVVNEGDDAHVFTAGESIDPTTVLEVGDVVAVQGTTKGRGFAGAVKRYGFHGGPKTHGQSDRHRAVGSIGAGTTPGRVLKGKKMPGHYGVDTKTVSGLVVLHIDAQKGEIWLSGPVPGALFSSLKITKTGVKKDIQLNKSASGIVEPKEVETTEVKE